MEYKASKWLKWLYCLSLVAIVFPSGLLGSSGWIGMATGGGLLGGGLIVGLPIVLICVYRIVQVVRFPTTLDAIVSGKLAKVLRTLGISLMVLGLFASALILFIGPLTSAMLGQQGGNGMAFFVAGVVLYSASTAGLLPGILLFEVSRSVGSRTSKDGAA